MNSSAIFRSTSKREPATHDCPWLRKIERATPAAVRFKSASAKTTLGDLPPSSSVTRLSDSAAAAITRFPVATPPVNAIPSTPGCDTSAAPAAPWPGRMLSTPGGSPASIAISPSAIAVSGASSEGL